MPRLRRAVSRQALESGKEPMRSMPLSSAARIPSLVVKPASTTIWSGSTPAVFLISSIAEGRSVWSAGDWEMETATIAFCLASVEICTL